MILFDKRHFPNRSSNIDLGPVVKNKAIGKVNLVYCDEAQKVLTRKIPSAGTRRGFMPNK